MRSMARPALFVLVVTVIACGAAPAAAPSNTLTGSPTTVPITSPQPAPSPALVLGGELCVPSSPRIPNSLGIIGTVVGTTSEGTQLFALMHPVIAAGSDVKIIVRMTGNGGLEATAQASDGTRVLPRLIEAHTQGSSFEAPGDEWGVFYKFPKAGCWQLHFSRPSGSGDIWFIATPAQ